MGQKRGVPTARGWTSRERPQTTIPAYEITMKYAEVLVLSVFGRRCGMFALPLLLLMVLVNQAAADEWGRFRGPNGTGVWR